MKILTIGNFTTGWDGSICDEEHIAAALEGFGHDVQRQQRDALTYMPQFQPDFVLIAQWDGYTEEWLDHLKDLVQAPVVYWAFDHQDQDQEWHKQLIKRADLYLSKRIADSVFPNWQWLSQDFAPSFLDKYDGEVEQDIDVLFTGSYLPWATERVETLRAIDKYYELHIYSFTPDAWKAEGFKNVFGPQMDLELPRLIARAKINLSIDHTIEAGYWSDRNAQIMICGGNVLFRYVPMSEVRFKDNVDYFYGVDDCLDKIAKWERREGDMSAYNFAWENLTVNDRVNDLLTIVKNIL